MDIDLIRKRARFMALSREFFSTGGYLEVETPILAPYLIPEPAIEVFRTECLCLEAGFREGYLIPSPELWMKRLIARGVGDIFQITKSFRNMELTGPYHSPEFTLLEWYTVGHDYFDSIDVLERYLRFIGEELEGAPRWLDSFPRLSMRTAFREYAGMDLDSNLNRDRILRWSRSNGIEASAEDTWEQIFHRIFLTKVEPRLAEMEGLILYDYPAAVPTTAKARDGYAERWELYMGGVEVANCYTEESSCEKMREFLRAESERKRSCRVPHRIDEGFAELFSAGFPACSGVALGMDRLFMLTCGEASIDRVMLFPFK